MSAFQIKMLAIIFMVFDHVGLFLFPNVYAFRLIGRLSFPLFAWMIANGFIHTRNQKAYLIRLALFAVVSQIPYSMALSLLPVNNTGLNIFFTLATGLVCLIYIKAYGYKSIPIVFILSYLASKLMFDYGAYGVLAIVFFYVFYKRPFLAGILLFSSSISFYILPHLSNMSVLYIGQVFSVVSVFFISRYDGSQGPKMKYLFYLFYPLHFLVFYLLKI